MRFEPRKYSLLTQYISEYLAFIDNVKETKLSQDTLGFVGSGNVYVYGKSKDESTNFYFHFDPKIRSVELNEFLGLVKFLLLLVRNQTCIPGYLERINLIISLKDNQCSTAFMIHFVDRLKTILTRTLPFIVSRVIFLGDITTFQDKYKEFNHRVKGFCEVLHFEEGDFDSMLKIVEEDHLEKRFGGLRPDLEEYWPPIHHTAPNASIDDEELGKLRLVPFFIYDEDVESFTNQHIPNGISVDKRARVSKGQGYDQSVLSAAKSISETLTRGGEDRVKMRKTIDQIRGHSQKPEKGRHPHSESELDDLDKDTIDLRPNSRVDDQFEISSQRLPAFRAERLAEQRGMKKKKNGGVIGLMDMFGCCGGR